MIEEKLMGKFPYSSSHLSTEFHLHTHIQAIPTILVSAFKTRIVSQAVFQAYHSLSFANNFLIQSYLN